MRVLVLFVALAACRPEKVVIPHDHSRPVNPEVNHEVGSTAPESSVVHARDGSNVELADLWAKKRVVLVFYMGHWCPHCQKQLGDLNEHQRDFVDATVIGVSSDTPDDAGALHDKLGLVFDIYSDADLSVIGRWGVADYGASIAKPATFVIQPGGQITFQKIGASQTDRPTVDELIAAAKPRP